MEKRESLQPVSSGFCVLCSAKTCLVCHRCGDFYCSKKCQLKDWQRHRYICFPMPALVQPMECSAFGNVELPAAQHANSAVAQLMNVEVEKTAESTKNPKPSDPFPPTSRALDVNGSDPECDKTHDKQINVAAAQPASNNTTQNMHNKTNNKNDLNNSSAKKTNLRIISPPYEPMPLNGSIVYVVGFRSANRCFVREASESAEKAYFDVCYKINLLGKEQPKVQKLKIYGFALAKHNGLYHRVKILPANSNQNPRLHFIDLGIVKNRNGVEMLEINSELLELPCHTLEVQLKDVPNYSVNNEVIKFLTQFVDGRYLASVDGHKHIKLQHPKQSESINSQIRVFCSSMHIYGSASQAFDKKSTPPKADVQKPNNINNNNNLGLQNEFKGISLSSQESPTTANHKFETDQNMNTKLTQFAKAIDDHLKQDQPTVGKQKDTEINSSIKLDLNNAEAKSQDIVAKETIPGGPQKTEKTENVTNKPDTKNVNDFNDLPKATSANAETFSIKPQPIQIPSIIVAKPHVEPVLIAPFEIRRFSSKDNKGLDVFIVDNVSVARGIIGAFDSTYARDFTDLHARLAEFKDSKPYRPALKEYVIAKFENEWYRARVMDIKTTQLDCTYNVMYLEFTNAATISDQDIRRYPSDLTVPCHTSICLIEGFPHRPTKAQITFLEEKLQMHSLLHIDSVSYLQDMALVKCKALLDELNIKS